MEENKEMKFYTPEEAKEILRYKTIKTIYRKLKSGELPAKRTPSGRYLISEESLNAFLK